jgi:hypothetical protein
LFDRLQFVGQIFVDAIAYHKQLYVLKQTVAPKNAFGSDLVKASLISMPERFNLFVPTANH